jgi:hypothetical protein
MQLRDTVAGIIFMATFLLPERKSLWDMLGGKPLPWMNMKVCAIRLFHLPY